MRVGLSWDWKPWDGAPFAWPEVLVEIERADQLGFDSVWLSEGRGGAAGCPAPAIFLSFAAKKTRCVRLYAAGRRVTGAHPVHIAEEVAVLDTLSRGRAGIAFAGAAGQGVAPGHVHEVIDFVTSAWATDELRYRGDHVRFPAHTPDDAPLGASVPESGGDSAPQWEWGPDTPDFLSVTPKPYAPRTPVSVEIEDDETLVWAARSGVSPMVAADVPTAQAVERLARYRDLADEAGRSRREVEAVLERRISLDGPADERTLGGSPRDVLNAIRELRAKTAISHFVWRRDIATPVSFDRFASEVRLLLQAR